MTKSGIIAGWVLSLVVPTFVGTTSAIERQQKLEEAVKLFNQHQYKKAYELVKDLKTDKPSLALLRVRAFTEMYCNKNEAAIADANELLKINPNEVTAYLVRSAAYLDQQKYKESIDDSKRVLMFGPGDVTFQKCVVENNLGRAYEGLGDAVSAKEWYSLAKDDGYSTDMLRQ